MRYIIGKNIAELKDTDILGVGGEGTVYSYGNDSAIKIYHPPKTVEESAILDWRTKKLAATLGKSWSSGTVHPLEQVSEFNTKLVRGFRMGLIGKDFKEFKWLSQKKYRLSHNIDEKFVTRVFLNLYDNTSNVHNEGDCIGDFNDSNDFFQEDVPNPETLLVDVDNFQINMNGTIWNCIGLYQDFANPRFFKDKITDSGSPFISNPVFEPEDDWYSFLVQYFKSLLCVHPYGGTYDGVNSLPERAKKKISVLNKKVVLPPVALPFSILSGELKDYFYEVFENGLREVFPRYILENYLIYVESGVVVKYQPNKNVQQFQSTILMEGWGNVVELVSQNGFLKILTNKEGKVYYHVLDGDGNVVKRLPLFFHIPNAIYSFLGDYLLVSTGVQNHEIMVLDLSKNEPRGVTKFATGDFSGKQRVFTSTNSHIYRILNGVLLRGVIDETGTLFDKAVIPVTARTLIFPDTNSDKIFGFFRQGIDIVPWVIINGIRYDLDLTELKQNEIVEEDGVAVRFSRDSLIVLRKTQIKGVQKLHIDEIDLKTTNVVKHRETQDLSLFSLVDDVLWKNGFVRYEDDKVMFML